MDTKPRNMKPNPIIHCVVLSPQTDVKKLETLRKRNHPVILDDLVPQLEELYRIRHPQTIRTGIDVADVRRFVRSIYDDAGGKNRFGNWAWYPWKNTLIHFLPEDMHTELRTSRNRNLISKEEQERYYHAHVGVAGLSVGNAVVSNILHTGGAKYLRIADSDVMSGSNTNRIRLGFDTIGLPKTTLVAREIYLTNPYADVSIYDRGITEQTIESFLTYPTPLTVVVDEMDDLYMKIQLRICARRHRIPVVMAADNGDGVVVDIERYDLEPDRPLMHGDVPEGELLAIRPGTPRHIAARIISKWVKPENIAERMMESLMELGSTLYTWPQLGNAATMAGSIMSYVVRRIAVGLPVVQGKVVITPDALFVPGYTSPEASNARKEIRKKFLKGMNTG